MSGYETVINMITRKKCPKSMVDDYIELMQSIGKFDMNDSMCKKMISEYIDRFGYFDF